MRFAWIQVSKLTRWIAISITALILVMVVLIHVFPPISRFALNRPSVCVMKTTTGIPCLGCRGTRAAFAFADGRLDLALFYNPFAACLGIALVTWSFGVAISGRAFDLDVDPHWSKLGWTLFVVGLIGNWIYVVSQGG